jgi:anaerobic magnesium-protoporphyrin IX monomethyl ester cyclase
MKINLVNVEEGITALGFRKMASMIKSINSDTHTYYLALGGRPLWKHLVVDRPKDYQPLVRQLAETVAQADLIGFSSFSDNAPIVEDLIAEVRRLNPRCYTVWGGVHSIIVPEESIKHADAVCTGEGELAFAEFFEKFKDGRDFLATRNFWFRHNGTVIRNDFRPLMNGEEMSTLPLLEYASGDERALDERKGFRVLTRNEYLRFNGLSYNTIWTIGCPFHCTFCGNTKFIENDRDYRKLRYPTLEYILREIERAVEVHPHISTVVFHDDSFMALPIEVLREFAQEYKRRINIPFDVVGVIPNYVRDIKFDILCSAGMARIRMGIQSGSARILEFYQRPTPPAKVLEAATIVNRYTPYMVPPAYDIISDNPIETKQDVEDTLRLVNALPRPFTLNLFSLRVQPNTAMATQFKDLNVAPEDIGATYHALTPTLANALLYLLTIVRPPAFLFEWWLRKAQPARVDQRMYPRLHLCLRFLYLSWRGLASLRHMEFVYLPGRFGFVLYKLGVVSFWRRHLMKKYQPLPATMARRDKLELETP